MPPAGTDLDGDGLPELVVMGFGGFLGVYDRYGRFLPGWPKDMSVGQNLSDGYAMVPLGDGTRGIAMGTSGGQDDHVFLYDPAGRLLPGWPRPSPHRVRGVSAGDLDGDNRPELLFAAESLTLGYHLDGTVMEGWPLDVRDPLSQCEPMIVDLTDDGMAEVVTFHSFADWFVTGWRADSTLIQAVQIFGSLELGSQPPTFGDLDGDGLLDMTLAARSGFLNAPGRVHVFGFHVPVNEAGMQWPTPAHDYARTSTWEPSTRHLEGRGSTAPGSLMPGDPGPLLTLFLEVPGTAPVEAGLAVTALAGVGIPPIPVEILPGGPGGRPGDPGRLCCRFRDSSRAASHRR
ncbi:MAG: FG-GAP repeat domain-containing protein [Acidobacteriota bacterium]